MGALEDIAAGAPRRFPAGSLLFATTAILAVLATLLDVSALAAIAAALLALFVFLEFGRIPLPQKLASSILLALTLAVAVPRGMLWEAVVGGLQRTLPFVLIFASVVWLQTAARESPSVVALRRLLEQLGPGRRFTALSVAAHLLGSGFNLASVALLAPMFEREPATGRTGARLRAAVLWGFGSATCWSPLYVGTAAILASVPGARWLDALPYGLLFGAYFLVAATVYDRLFRRQAEYRAAQEGPGLDQFTVPTSKLLAALAILFAAIMSLVEVLRLPLTVSIALVAPGYALIWLWRVHRQTDPGRVFALSGEVFLSLPRMRSETTLFACANMFGYVLAELASTGLAIDLPLPSGSLFLQIAVLLTLYLAASAAGIHPIVTLVVFVSAVDPASLGIPLPLLVALMMALWGVGTSVSPFSGTTLYVAQLSSVSSFRIAWVWDGPFYLVATVGLGALVAWLA